MIPLCLHSVVTPSICGRTPWRWPSCWHNGVTAWPQNKPRDNRTTIMPQEIVGRHQQQYSFTFIISEREAKYLMNYDVLLYVSQAACPSCPYV